MNALLLGLALLAHPSPPEACRRPVCACVDATKPEGCPTAEECEQLCADHGGRAPLHKRRRRRHLEEQKQP